MIKILHLGKFYPPDYGGIESVTKSIIDDTTKEIRHKIICFSKKRKKAPNSINSFRKKRKYNLTVKTNFKDWSDFTDYVKNEKEKMNEPKNVNKKHFKDWNEFTQHLKTSSF